MNLKWVANTNDPSLQHLLPPSKKKLAAVLYDSDTPIAAGYGSIDKSDFAIQVDYPEFASPEAIKPFLLALEDETKKESCLSSIIVFSDEYPQLKQLKEALQQSKWSPPEKWMINCYFDHSFNPPWINKKYPIPDDYCLKPWSQLTHEQIEHVRHKGEQFVYPTNLSPFLHSNPDPNYSLCLLQDNEVIGWMMTRMVSEDSISYDSFFVELKCRRPNIILALLSESVKAVLNSPIPKAVMEVNLTQTDNSYVNFVYKRYVPYIKHYNYSLRSWKLI